MATREEIRANQELFVAAIITSAILTLFALSSPTNRAAWNSIVAIAFGWSIADYLTGSLEPETSGRAHIHGRTLPVLNITLGFGIYFFVVILATTFSEYIGTPILLSFLAQLTNKAVNVNVAYVSIVSFSATMLVFLDFRWNARKDKGVYAIRPAC